MSETRTVWIRWTVEFPIEFNAEYATKEHIEFYRNEGTFCNDRVLDELQAWLDAEKERQGYWESENAYQGPCLCQLNPQSDVNRIEDSGRNIL